MRLLCARGTAKLRKVISGSATQDLWLRNGKVRSQANSMDQSRFPERRTVRKVRRRGRRGRRASDRAEKSKYTVFEFDLGEKEEQVVCRASALALAMTDEARREAKM